MDIEKFEQESYEKGKKQKKKMIVSGKGAFLLERLGRQKKNKEGSK